MKERRSWQTIEFWVSAIVTVAGLVASSGLFSEDSMWFKMLGLLISGATAMGYNKYRTAQKEIDAKKAIAGLGAETRPPNP